MRQAFHGLCTLDDYRAAIAFISERVAGAHLFVFSDDPSWARHNLQTDLLMEVELPCPLQHGDDGEQHRSNKEDTET